MAAADNDNDYPSWINVEDTSRWWVKRIVEVADGDDWELLRMCREQVEAAEHHRERVLEVRDAVVERLREQGEPMTAIASVAGVTDSALSRRILARGGKRRVDRRKRRKQ